MRKTKVYTADVYDAITGKHIKTLWSLSGHMDIYDNLCGNIGALLLYLAEDNIMFDLLRNFICIANELILNYAHTYLSEKQLKKLKTTDADGCHIYYLKGNRVYQK